MPYYNLEICVDSVAAALLAISNGATRLQLCSNLAIGGTTPTGSLLELVKEITEIPIHVLIKPHKGIYTYDAFEFEEIKREIIVAKQHLADGVVIGILENSKLDFSKLKLLVELAKPMHVTLDKCFDLCQDHFVALDEAIDLGFDSILTSTHVFSNLAHLCSLFESANENIELIMHNEISSYTLPLLLNSTKAQSFHIPFASTHCEEIKKIHTLLVNHFITLT
ncbi:MAG: copper homeostasis protein CutC [Cellulosilyticaceae bacterium]